MPRWARRLVGLGASVELGLSSLWLGLAVAWLLWLGCCGLCCGLSSHPHGTQFTAHDGSEQVYAMLLPARAASASGPRKCGGHAGGRPPLALQRCQPEPASFMCCCILFRVTVSNTPELRPPSYLPVLPTAPIQSFPPPLSSHSLASSTFPLYVSLQPPPPLPYHLSPVSFTTSLLFPPSPPSLLHPPPPINRNQVLFLPLSLSTLTTTTTTNTNPG